MESLNEDMDKLIDRFLAFCGIIDENLTNVDKLSLLKNQKQFLEIEVDFFYDRASNTSNKEIISDCLTRMDVNKMAITEINMCISYLKNTIKIEKRLQKRIDLSNCFSKFKSLFLKR